MCVCVCINLLRYFLENIISVPQNLNKTRLILGQKVSRGTGGGGVLEGVA